VGQQLAAVRVYQAGLSGRLPAAAVEHLALGVDPGDLPGQRPHQLHLERQRRVADSGGQRSVDRAAERRVEQGRRVAAVDDADRVVVLLAGLALEHGAARLDLDRLHPHQHGDRRGRQLAGGDRLHVPEPGHAGAAGRDWDGVLPGQLAPPKRLRRLGGAHRGSSG
jgi:hypothetical protein